MEITKLTQQENESFSFHRQRVSDKLLGAQKLLWEAAESLKYIRDNKLYRVEYDTFEAFCLTEFGFSKQRGHQLLQAAETVENLKKSTIVDFLPTSESQARPLTKLEAPLQREAWRETVERHGDNITAAKVKEVADEYDTANAFMKEAQQPPTFDRPPMSEAEILAKAKEIRQNKSTGNFHISSGENDWYTPASIIDKCRSMIGYFDIDPASSEKANEIVKADAFFTKENSGLDADWYGNIWLNPPYSMPEIKQFCNKAIASLDVVNTMFVLTNNSTDTNWCQNLLSACNAFCLLNKRVKFYNPSNETLAARQGQIIFYFGGNTQAFYEAFREEGFVYYEH